MSFSKRLGNGKLDNLSLRCIVELLGINQTRNLKSRKYMLLRFCVRMVTLDQKRRWDAIMNLVVVIVEVLI